ncbi:MAG: uroporphyrinogen-III synthase [Flavobacteriaceae bacterium]
MSPFRLLSTKVLKPAQRHRLVQAGLTYREWNFMVSLPLPFTFKNTGQSYIFTSQNAVNAVFNQGFVVAEKCYCVGQKTKSLLEEKGQKVLKMCENSADLASFLVKQAKKDSFLFFTTQDRRPDIEKALHHHKIPLEIVEVYTTHTQPKAMGQFDGVLFFSPAGVNSYLTENSLNDTLSFAIGATTAETLKPYTQKLIIANQPTVEHLIAAVRNHLTTQI